jgi:hypothetical protein
VHDDVNAPVPPSERRAWLIALALLLLGAGVLAAVLSGAVGSTAPTSPVPAPPAVLAATATPTAPANAEVAHRMAAAGGTGRGGKAVAMAAGKTEGELAGGVTTGGIADGTKASGVAGGSGTARRGTAVSSAGGRPAASSGPIVADPPAAQLGGETGDLGAPEVHIPAAWEAGFYPIYAEAQRVFGVNWLLLASIHRQESAFSTAPTTYHGLNFAHCCGGPMQFNVTNGPLTTWDLVRNAYLYGRRPAVYDHQTAHHPSIYDDFDAIMAAAWLLSSDGAAAALDDSAWWAAYDYYGHDTAGVEYADQVLAGAIGWSQHGFCINCGLEPAMVQAVYEAYGAPVLSVLDTATLARARHSRHRR